MSKKEILNAALEHGNWAFRQGYEAAIQGILFEDNKALSKMPEALLRVEAYKKIADKIEENN